MYKSNKQLIEENAGLLLTIKIQHEMIEKLETKLSEIRKIVGRPECESQIK